MLPRNNITTPRVTVLFLLMVSVSIVGSQTIEDSVSLPDLEVVEQRTERQPISSTSQSWTREEVRALPVRQASGLLNTSSSVYIKGYGPGSLSTASIRGGSAAQLLVLWNDIPIHSPMLGQLDLSLLPVDMFDQSTLTEGGQSASHGSGAIAGVFELRDKPSYDNRWTVGGDTEVGAYGHVRQMLHGSYSRGRWYSRTRLSYLESDNDFSYRPAPQLAEQRQTHAAFIGRDAMQDLSYRLNDKSRLTWSTWYQSADRQIPATLVQNISEAYQKDRSLRSQLHYQRTLPRGVFHLRAAFIQEDLDYFDPQIRLSSPSRFTSYWGRSKLEQRWGIHKIIWGIDYVHIAAEANGYLDITPTEYRLSAYTAWGIHRDRWGVDAKIRQAVIDDRWIDPSVQFAGRYDITPWLKADASMSYDYRVPTLNDRYWQPGGHPDLRPESGWSTEIGASFHGSSSHVSWEVSMAGFHRRITDWILWHPAPEVSYWSPNNLAEVWSRGLQAGIMYTWQMDQLSCRVAASHSYIRSTNEAALPAIAIEEGDQLIYTPEHNTVASLHLSLHRWGVTYQHRITDEVQAINEVLPGYNTGDLQLRYTTSIGKARIQAYLVLNNLWDEDYIVIERRPMPGRHARVGLRYLISSDHNQSSH